MNKEDLQKALEDFRYVSSQGIGDRSLMPHHIEALTEYLWSKIKPPQAIVSAKGTVDGPEGA